MMMAKSYTINARKYRTVKSIWLRQLKCRKRKNLVMILERSAQDFILKNLKNQKHKNFNSDFRSLNTYDREILNWFLQDENLLDSKLKTNFSWLIKKKQWKQWDHWISLKLKLHVSSFVKIHRHWKLPWVEVHFKLSSYNPKKVSFRPDKRESIWSSQITTIKKS